jgi:hypothetical protein
MIAFSFIPTFATLSQRQAEPVVLLGIVGFFVFSGQKKWILAGVALMLMSVKPHIVYLVWIAL